VKRAKEVFRWYAGDVWRQLKPDKPGQRTLQILAVIPIMALPERYRKHMLEFNPSELRRAGSVSGLFQFAFFGFLYSSGYLILALLRMTRLPSTDLPLEEFITDPRTLPVAYLFVEGLVRYVSARYFEMPLPILPLGLVAAVHGLMDRWRESSRLGPPVPDRLTRGDGTAFDWRIESWAPKPTWETNPYLIISYRDTFYEIVGREKRDPPRPHVYLLKRPPSWKLVVQPEKYNPVDTIPK
jgi:hypothetical protein